MKKIASFICFLLGINGLFAQTQHRHEWNINVGMGNSILQYSPNEEGTPKPETGGGNVGFCYSHFFSRGFGFSLGMEVGMYSSSIFNISTISTAYAIPTPPGLSGDFTLHASYSNLNEEQSVLFVQLPFMLNFQLPLGGSTFMYLGVGGKYSFPVSATYKQTVNSLTTIGYSSYTQQIYSNMPKHGFDTYRNIVTSGKWEVEPSLMLALEGGFKWKISPKNYLYAGVYLDKGTNNILKKTPKELLEYNNASPTTYQYNSILQTNLSGVPAREITTFAVGVKIRIAFGSGKEHGKRTTNPPVDELKPNKPEIKPEPKVKPKPILDKDTVN
jgi:hypothetical protein